MAIRDSTALSDVSGSPSSGGSICSGIRELDDMYAFAGADSTARTPQLFDDMFGESSVSSNTVFKYPTAPRELAIESTLLSLMDIQILLPSPQEQAISDKVLEACGAADNADHIYIYQVREEPEVSNAESSDLPGPLCIAPLRCIHTGGRL